MVHIQGPDAHLQITVHALDGDHFMVRTSPESIEPPNTEQIFGASIPSPTSEWSRINLSFQAAFPK